MVWSVGVKNYKSYILFLGGFSASILIFDHLVWKRKHPRQFVNLFAFEKKIVRPSCLEGYPSSIGFVFATIHCLQARLCGHVPCLGCAMDNYWSHGCGGFFVKCSIQTRFYEKKVNWLGSLLRISGWVTSEVFVTSVLYPGCSYCTLYPTIKLQ